MENKDNVKENEEKNNIEVVIGDSSNLSFSEVGDFMGDIKPQSLNSKKNIIIPKNKVVNKTADSKTKKESTENVDAEKSIDEKDNKDNKDNKDKKDNLDNNNK